MSDTGNTPGTGPQGTGDGGQDPAATAPPTGQQPNSDPQGTGQQGGEDAAARIARLEAELAEARKEAGKQRTTAKQRAAEEAKRELAHQIGRALGIVDDDQAPDPDQLAQQLAAEQARARQTAVELAVYRAAPAAGADPDALLDSRAFAAAVADLDPTDTDAIKAAITAAVEANPRLAAQQQAPRQQAPAGPARTGAEFAGGGGAAEITPAQFAAMNYAQRVELMQSDPDTYRRLAGS
ncbi:hypothetical protein QEP66_01070 [Streptomyces sp. LB8]|uniref:hypothetical protein n=1 Tax=Streptomyces sp. LB8 TaxID=3042509 RepID=UPI002647EA68|nr:hypothetical protein [Streptomyces sp. LB8]MDN5380722.1 hypothetical protein [Streptomyces sp. LB8]